MKCFRGFFAICTLVLIFFSCNNTDVITEIPSVDSTIDSFNANYFVKDGIIHFTSDSAFANTLGMLSELNNSEFKSWEVKTGFKSLKTELSNVYVAMDQCSSLLEFETLLSDNNDILTCSDSVVLPIIESETYSRFVNREGYYYVGTALHKVCGSKVLVSLTGDTQEMITALNTQMGFESNKELLVFDYTGKSSQEPEIKFKGGTLSEVISAVRTANNRRCILEMKAIHTCGYYPVYDPYGTYAGYIPEYIRVYRTKKVEVVVNNYKYSWGKYRSYKTKCEVHDISFQVDNFTRSLSYSKSDGDVNSLTVLFTLSNQYVDYPWGISYPDPVPVQPNFTSAYARATNDGIGVNWAIVSK